MSGKTMFYSSLFCTLVICCLFETISAKEDAHPLSFENPGLFNGSLTAKALPTCSTTSYCTSTQDYEGDCRCQPEGGFCFDHDKMDSVTSRNCAVCYEGECASGSQCFLVGVDWGYCLDCVNQQWSKAECASEPSPAPAPPSTSGPEKCSSSKSGSSTCKSINCNVGQGIILGSSVDGKSCKCECCDGRTPQCEWFNTIPDVQTLSCRCTGSKDEVPDCVETQWLEDNGHSEGILRKREMGSVLCIPGLPCGTPGHLLNYCESASQCSLYTYKELCSTIFECTTEMKPVSRLRSSYDWKDVSISGEGFYQVYLSSLSVHEDAKRMSLSYLIANVARKMADKGLGAVCDSILLKLLDITENRARQKSKVCNNRQFDFTSRFITE